MSTSNAIFDPGETAVIRNLRSVKRYATNPLLVPTEVRSRRKTTRVLNRGHMVDSASGAVLGDTALFSTKAVDDAEFVKLFDQGIRQAFDLSNTGMKVFQLVLRIVSRGTMQADFIALHVSYATDPESPMKMNEKTYWRGMKELLAKKFVAAGTIPGFYWINPHLFFKGDRLLIVNEYVRAHKGKAAPEQQQPVLPAPQPTLF